MSATEKYEATYPPDVRAAALAAMTTEPRRNFMSWMICDAILAERKRCADIARTVDMYDGDRLKNSNPRETIAAAIESGEQS